VVRLPDVRIVAAFLHDQGAWKDNPILGLTAGLFDRLWLWMHPLDEQFHRGLNPPDPDGVQRHDWWLGEVHTPMPAVRSPRHG
jgi:hypothetical protein